jgi:bacterioferritin-associated ferredoxin
MGVTNSDRRPIIYVCFDVVAKTIETAIADQRFTRFEEVSGALRADTNCSPCRPAIRALRDTVSFIIEA